MSGRGAHHTFHQVTFVRKVTQRRCPREQSAPGCDLRKVHSAKDAGRALGTESSRSDA